MSARSPDGGPCPRKQLFLKASAAALFVLAVSAFTASDYWTALLNVAPNALSWLNVGRSSLVARASSPAITLDEPVGKHRKWGWGRKNRAKEEGGWTLFSTHELLGGTITAHTRPAENGVQRIRVAASNMPSPWSHIVDTFLNQDKSMEWNKVPRGAEVVITHLERGHQVQTYHLPWPFFTREYLLHCESGDVSRAGHQTRCVPVESHPLVPRRKDRVRGHSVTTWTITPAAASPRDRSDVHLDVAVDPAGNLPKWIVNLVGKQASVNMVANLMRLAASS